MKNASPERPRHIDRLREGSCSITITPADDDSPIRYMISIEERLLVVKDKGIYEILHADQIDPERINLSAPNAFRQILPFGALDAWVGAIVLTARELFLTSYFDSKMGRDAFNILLDVAQDIAGAKTILQRFLQQEAEAQQPANLKTSSDRSVELPFITNVEASCTEFIQRMGHAQQKLFKVAQLFYSDMGRGMWDGLKAKVDAGPQNLDDFPQFLSEATVFLKLIRNARNCVEHPKPNERLVVSNFSLNAHNELVPPTIEVIHPKTPVGIYTIGEFFAASIERMVSVVEGMIVFLAARNLRERDGLQVCVVELKPEQRKFAHVRYSYGALLGSNLVPLS